MEYGIYNIKDISENEYLEIKKINNNSDLSTADKYKLIKEIIKLDNYGFFIRFNLNFALNIPDAYSFEEINDIIIEHVHKGNYEIVNHLTYFLMDVSGCYYYIYEASYAY